MMDTLPVSTKAIYQKRYNAYLDRIKELIARKKALDKQYVDHIKRSNAHQLTKAHVRLDNVANVTRALEAEAKAETGTIVNKYMTPLRVKQVIDTQFTPRLVEHTNIKSDNPHGLTPAQLASMTTSQINTEANRYYDRGVTVDYTYRLGGETLRNLYNLARVNLDASEIRTGLLKDSNLIRVAGKPASSTLTLHADSSLMWAPIRPQANAQVINLYAIDLHYAQFNITVANIAASMNIQHAPVGMPDGVLGAVRIHSSGYISKGYGNGSNINSWNWRNVVFLQVRNGRWVG